MAKDIDLKSAKWNNIVFEGKNKDYGAYQLRMSSSKRLVIAFLICAAFVTFISFLPALIEAVVKTGNTADNISESTVFADLQNGLLNEKDIIPEGSSPPKHPLKTIIQFTVPEIVDVNEIKEDEEIELYQDTSWGIEEGTGTGFGFGTGGGGGVEILPEFPGGDYAREKFLIENIKYPEVAIKARVEGTVIVCFVIEPDGSVTNIEIVRGKDPHLDAEALRVVKLMPKWKPAKQRGKAVRFRISMPVTFALN